MTLHERLSQLTPQQMSRLQVAFEEGFAQYIEISQTEFIGVNTDPIKHLQVVDRAGCWTYGIDKSKKG